MTAEEYRKMPKKRPPAPVSLHLTGEGREKFVRECIVRGLPAPIPEYKPFTDIGRKHSIDFYFFHAGLKLALEIEGWGHRTDKRYKEDQFKYNELAVRKFLLIRVKPRLVYHESTFDLIKRFFDGV